MPSFLQDLTFDAHDGRLLITRVITLINVVILIFVVSSYLVLFSYLISNDTTYYSIPISQYYQGDTQIYPVLYLLTNTTQCAPDYFAVNFTTLCLNTVTTDQYPIVCFYKYIDPSYYNDCYVILQTDYAANHIARLNTTSVEITIIQSAMFLGLLVLLMVFLILQFMCFYKCNTSCFCLFATLDYILQIILTMLILILSIFLTILYYDNSTTDYFLAISNGNVFMLNNINLNFSQQGAALIGNWGFYIMFYNCMMVFIVIGTTFILTGYNVCWNCCRIIFQV